MNNEKVKFLLNWNHFGEHLSSCMTKLMTDSSYSDIIIATADQHMIYSHRFVLANSSKYFHRLFRQMSRTRGFQLVIALPEIKYDIFKILMNYMYKGETQVPHELLPSVIKAGQFLEINGLVNLNETESVEYSENSSKYSTRERKAPTVHPSSSGNDSKQFKRMPSTLRDNVHSRENSHNGSKNVLHVEKAKRQNVSNDNNSKLVMAEENGKENSDKIMKAIKGKNQSQEKKDEIELPLKRKSITKGIVKKASLPSSSFSTESCTPRKLRKKNPVDQEIFDVKVKEEKESSKSPVSEKDIQKGQEAEEKVTIKMEAPDIEEIVYNELQCEFCCEVYTNPSDWVKHMTDQHQDMGYQSYKNLDKSAGGNAVITCVVCSCICFSAADWAKHLRTWHTERELMSANMLELNKKLNKSRQ